MFRHLRLSLVLICALAASIAHAGKSSGPTNHPQINWVLAELAELDAPAGSAVEEYRRELLADLRAARRNSRNWGMGDREVESFTTHNPAYWRAVLAMGDDRVLLFWLHGLLLEQAGRNTEAFEWTVMVHRGVFLSEDFDARWLDWEHDLLAQSDVGFIYRDSHSTLYSGKISSSQRSAMRRGLKAERAGMGPQARVPMSASPDFLGLAGSPELIWDRWFMFSEAEFEAAPRGVQDVLMTRIGVWPPIPHFAPDELRHLAYWLVDEGQPSFAMVMLLQAKQQGMSIEAGYWQRALVQLCGADTDADFSLFSTGRSSPYVMDEREWEPARIGMNRWLARESCRQLRRIEILKPTADWWYFGERGLIKGRMRELERLGEHEELRKLAKGLPPRLGPKYPRTEWLMKAALLSQDSDLIAGQVAKLVKKNRKKIKMPFEYRLAAMELGKWSEVTRCHELINKHLQHPEREALNTIYAHIAAIMSGSERASQVRDALVEIDDGVWLQRMGLALLGELSREEILAESKSQTSYRTSYQASLAKFVLAFAPDSTMASRRADLEAVVAAGHMNDSEYLIASYALRDLEREESR